MAVCTDKFSNSPSVVKVCASASELDVVHIGLCQTESKPRTRMIRPFGRSAIRIEC